MSDQSVINERSISSPDVERYSDKYHTSEQTDTVVDWSPGETPGYHGNQGKGEGSLDNSKTDHGILKQIKGS